MTLLKAPKFWNKKGILSTILSPLSYAYLKISKWKRGQVEPTKLPVPVVCVGNLVLGGAGKTPTVIAIVDILKKMGHTPHIVSRGYGAVVQGLKKVDPVRHHYLQVGDEPLMLSQFAPTWVSSNRTKAAKAAIMAGATVIVMDDGFQSNYLHKDLNILVIDALQGFGNECVFPAGPLREPIEEGLERADLCVIIGETPFSHHLLESAIHARFKPKQELKTQGERVIGFAGLGYPEKFKRSLENAGYKIIDFIPYADHYPYTITEIERLIKKAQSKNAKLITTSKDAIRIPSRYLSKINVFKVFLEFEEHELMQKAIEERLNHITQ